MRWTQLNQIPSSTSSIQLSLGSTQIKNVILRMGAFYVVESSFHLLSLVDKMLSIR